MGNFSMERSKKWVLSMIYFCFLMCLQITLTDSEEQSGEKLLTGQFRMTKTTSDYEELKKDVFKQGKWSTKWLMSSSLHMCKVMDIGEKNNFMYFSVVSNKTRKRH